MEKFCFAYWDTIFVIIAIVIGGAPAWLLIWYGISLIRLSRKEKKTINDSLQSRLSASSKQPCQPSQDLSSSTSNSSPTKKEEVFQE